MVDQANNASSAEMSIIHASIERRFTQALVGGLTLISFLLFWFGEKLLGLPYQFKHSGSLLAQDGFGRSIAGLIGAAVLLPGCALLADAVLRRRWSLAGLAVACAGLTAWSIRGGPMHAIIFYAASKEIFFRLAIENLILGGIVAALWNLLWKRAFSQTLDAAPITPPAKSSPKAKAKSEEKPSLAMALVAQAVTMAAVLLILLNHGDAKKQVIASVFIAGLAGTAIAESYFADRMTSRWYWLGPIVVGCAGYFIAFLAFPNWAGGNRLLESVSFAALARPLPLDYAGAGMFGALMGYWLAEKGPSVAD